MTCLRRPQSPKKPPRSAGKGSNADRERTKTMANRSLKLLAWPHSDQQAWSAAIAPGNVLDGRGPAARWAEATRASNIHSYGRWLAFVQDHLPERLEWDLGNRCTPDLVRGYLAQLQETTVSKSVSSSIIGLTRMMQVMAPENDWTW